MTEQEDGNGTGITSAFAFLIRQVRESMSAVGRVSSDGGAQSAIRNNSADFARNAWCLGISQKRGNRWQNAGVAHFRAAIPACGTMSAQRGR